jgi:hypothetical protein
MKDGELAVGTTDGQIFIYKGLSQVSSNDSLPNLQGSKKPWKITPSNYSLGTVCSFNCLLFAQIRSSKEFLRF